MTKAATPIGDDVRTRIAGLFRNARVGYDDWRSVPNELDYAYADRALAIMAGDDASGGETGPVYWIRGTG
jgi:hypothetical protein